MPGGRSLVRACALSLAALAVPGSSAAADFASRVDQRASEVRSYWTPQRVAGAEPAGQGLDSVRLGLLPPAPAERGRPFGVAPTAGAGVADGLLGDLLGGGSRQRRAAEPVATPNKAPYRTHGKVLFSLGGTNYQCSATVIRARNKRLVATAGHCVFDAREGGFARNWMFIPAKDGGSEPFGRWTAKRLATTRQWAQSTRDANINNDDVRFDVAFATMRKRGGRRLQNVVGARGIAFNRGRNGLHFNAFGYPAESPFGGTQPYVCSSNELGTDSGPPPAATRISCDMTGGASGGGWVIGGGRLNSVTSYGYECSPVDLNCLINGNPEEDRLFGPYFGETVKDLYRSQRR
jgi:V8-like Glu-specific endopeptidase